MNRMMEAWRRYQSRPKPGAPDVVEMEGVEFRTTEEKSMVNAMNDRQFKTVIRQIKRNDVDRVAMLRTATFRTLKRLGVKRDPGRAVAGKPPKGSDQGDAQSVFVWLSKVGREDAKAVEQIVAIDATATKRVKG